MQNEEILATFAAHARYTDIALIEGNKGLYDGLDLDGSNSNAALANCSPPPLFCHDARGMTRGVAPLIPVIRRSTGYPDCRCNPESAGGARHERNCVRDRTLHRCTSNWVRSS
jgi:cobyrinic acid a,c-diamide synthase